MLNLNEQWKQAYLEYLSEESNKVSDEVDSICEELSTAQKEVTRSYELLEQYYGVYLLEQEDDDKKDDEKNSINIDVNDIFKTLIDLKNGSKASYEPAASYTYQKISDMKFPDNIFFFIGQFIRWIKNVVVYFIKKFKNVIKRLVGIRPEELDPRMLELDLRRAKKVEQFSGAIDLGSGLRNSDITKAWRVDPKDIQVLEEGEDITLKDVLGIKKDKSIFVTFDLSRDLLNLKELVTHFFDLYDNAIGSNNENLFAADDLKVILKLFEDSLKNIQHGDLNVYSIGSNSFEVNTIDKNRVYDNLVTTNTNINRLKEAYMSTSAKIQDITKIISTKELTMISDLGVSRNILGSSTIMAIKNIMDALNARFKQAAAAEKTLNKIAVNYEDLVKKLQKVQQIATSVSTIQYDSIYSKKMAELLNAATWMSKIVSLRLAGLGLYIKELNDVRQALVIVRNIGK